MISCHSPEYQIEIKVRKNKERDHFPSRSCMREGLDEMSKVSDTC
ncbi:unnamed protein product, partial [Vitis vinifera]